MIDDHEASLPDEADPREAIFLVGRFPDPP
jgi:hypothetical protein